MTIKSSTSTSGRVLCSTLLCLVAIAHAAQAGGDIRFALKANGRIRELRYQFSPRQLRIDRLGEIIPSPPVNVRDLKKGSLAILHPHNGTYERATLTQRDAASGVTPPAVGMPTSIKDTPAQPSITPPTDWPEFPDDVPEGIGPRPGASTSSSPPAFGMPSGMPQFPIPEMPMEETSGEDSMTLIPQNQTHEYFGFSCRLYEVHTPESGIVSLWLCDDPRLPPFYLLMSEVPRRNRLEQEEQIARLLRQAKQFPFSVVWKNDTGDPVATWNVQSIRMDETTGPADDLFDVPAEFHLIE